MLAIFGWLSGNVKWLVYGAIAIAVMYTGWRAYEIVKQNAEYQVHVAALQAEVSIKEKQISGLESQIRLINEIIEQRDKEVKQLEDKLDQITFGLGVDENDPVPFSIQELFERLQQL